MKSAETPRLHFSVSLCCCWFTALMLVPASARGGSKPNCRDLIFDGAAGAASHDKVTIQVVDAMGNLIEQACKIQVQPNETHTHFAARLPGAWGDGLGLSCGDDSATLTKTCGNGFGRSCSHKFIFKQKKNGAIKKELVRVCCFESMDCAGPRLGKTQPATVPISVQTKVDPDLVFQPNVPPPVGIAINPVALDPIGLRQRPYATLQTCRASLGSAIGSLASVVTAMVNCEDDEVAGRLLGVDCTSSGSDDPRVSRAFDDFENRLTLAINDQCAPQGNPSDFGYTACPAPCDAINIMYWSDVASCMECLSEDAATGAVEDKYGAASSDVSLDAKGCQTAVGEALRQLVGVNLKETLLCEKRLDAATANLPEGISTCKTADPRGRRAQVEQKETAVVADNCSDAAVMGLTSCGTNQAEEIQCVLDNGRAVAAAAADAVFPDLHVCGNGSCDTGETWQSCPQDCSKRVFAWGLYTAPGGVQGNIGGIAGADAICQSSAQDAGLSGTFKAWLSDGSPGSDPASRFTHSSLPYVGLYGTSLYLVANDWSDLTSGTLREANGIYTDAYGNYANFDRLTNVNPDGTATTTDPYENCMGYTSSAYYFTTHVGNSWTATSAWTLAPYTSTCDGYFNVLCFQQ